MENKENEKGIEKSLNQNNDLSKKQLDQIIREIRKDPSIIKKSNILSFIPNIEPMKMESSIKVKPISKPLNSSGIERKKELVKKKDKIKDSSSQI